MAEPVKNEWIDGMLFLMRSNGTSERNDDAGKMYLALEELLERRKCDEEPWNIKSRGDNGIEGGTEACECS